jgi:hypothetical protein
MKGKKLSDGKGIGVQHRLSGTEIDKLQDFAVRINKSDVEKMRRAVRATYFHKLSTDKTHNMDCPQDSWCKYNTADRDKYSYHGLPEEVMLLTKPIYWDLSRLDLLRKYHHRRTQNPDESFNNMIWLRIPKTVFDGYSIPRMGIYDAVLSFNMGNLGRAKVLHQLGIQICYNTLRHLQAKDTSHIKKVDRVMDNMSKEARERRSEAKRKEEDLDDPECEAGKF